MKTKTRNILIAVAVLISIVIGFAGYGGYKLYSFLKPAFTTRTIPPDIEQPRVVSGDRLLHKSEVFKLGEFSIINSLRKSMATDDERERQRAVMAETALRTANFADIKVVGDTIVAVGHFGAFTFDPNFNVIKHSTFEPVLQKVKMGPFETDNYQPGLEEVSIVRLKNEKTGFLSYGSVNGMRVFDENGDQIWSYGEEHIDLGELFNSADDWERRAKDRTYVLQAAVGDLDGDGISEYTAARKNDGIRAFDQTGNEKWFLPSDFPNSELSVADLDGDGRGELIAKGASVIGGDGKVIRELKNKGDEVLLVPSEQNQLSLYSLDLYQNKLTYSDEMGKTIFECEAPLSYVKAEPETIEIPGHTEWNHTRDHEDAYRPRGLWVGLAKGKPKYLAVVAAFISIPRADLYIYDSSGKLVYDEVLDQQAETIAALPEADGTESLIVGGKSSIWKYTMNE
jgi:hypothetical protein